MSLDDEIRELVGQAIEKALKQIVAGELKPDAVWIGLAYRWLALPKVAARKAPEPE